MAVGEDIRLGDHPFTDRALGGESSSIDLGRDGLHDDALTALRDLDRRALRCGRGPLESAPHRGSGHR
jgi:hypothetical protein